MTNTAKTATVPIKAPIQAGGDVAAFRPQNFDEAWRLANALATGSAKMIPDHFRGDPGATFAAMAKGAELGLSPMAALQSIAVINGRPSLWGDALPALVLRGGHILDESVEGDGEKAIATATVTRSDTGQKITRTFSVDDAKKAQLWGKKGPWQQYPKRMLQMRARGFAVRDGCADLMLGLGMAEELRDMPGPIRDVTPSADETNAILAALPDQDTRDGGQEPTIEDAVEEQAENEGVTEAVEQELPIEEAQQSEDEPDASQDHAEFVAKIERRLGVCVDGTDIDEMVNQYEAELADINANDKATAGALEKLIDARRKELA